MAIVKLALLVCLVGLVVPIINGPLLASSLADPTRPIHNLSAPIKSIAVAAQLPRLNSILLAADRQIAIIDGKAYHRGDHIGAYQVANIFKKSVVLVLDCSRETAKSCQVAGEGNARMELKLNSHGVEENQQ